MNIGEQASTGTLTCQTVNCKGTVKYAALDPPIQNAFLGAEDGQILIGSTGSGQGAANIRRDFKNDVRDPDTARY